MGHIRPEQCRFLGRKFIIYLFYISMYRKYVWVTLNIKLFGSYVLYEQKSWGYYTLHIQELLILGNQCHEAMLMPEKVWSSAAVESAASCRPICTSHGLKLCLWVAVFAKRFHFATISLTPDGAISSREVLTYCSGGVLLHHHAEIQCTHSFTNVCEDRMHAKVHRWGHVTKKTPHLNSKVKWCGSRLILWCYSTACVTGSTMLQLYNF